MPQLTNKIIVVTGAAGTLCSVIARSLAAEGAKVVLAGRTEAKVVALADQIIADGGHALGLGTDVMSETSLRAALETIETTWGAPDILINGAGGKDLKALTDGPVFTPAELDGTSKGFFNIDTTALSREIELNIQGTVLPSIIFGKAIARKGGGSIVNFASMNSYRPLSRSAGYALAKAAIVNFTQWLAAYLAPAHIRVNAVAPGFFVNDRSRKLLMTEEGGFSKRGQQVINHTPAGRFGEADEMIGAVRWLIDDQAAAFVTGICVPVDGGFLACSGL